MMVVAMGRNKGLEANFL